MSDNGSRRESLLRIVAPLKDEVEKHEQQIAEIEQAIADFRESKLPELTELRELRREAIAIIRHAEPGYRKAEAKRAKAGSTYSRNSVEKTRQRIQALIRDPRMVQEADEGITQTWLLRNLEGASATTIKPALQQLVEDGIIRADRKTKGGGIAYALVT